MDSPLEMIVVPLLAEHRQTGPDGCSCGWTGQPSMPVSFDAHLAAEINIAVAEDAGLLADLTANLRSPAIAAHAVRVLTLSVRSRSTG